MQWQTTIKTAAYNQQNNTSQKYTIKQKEKKRKLADTKTRQRATRGIGYEIN